MQSNFDKYKRLEKNKRFLILLKNRKVNCLGASRRTAKEH